MITYNGFRLTEFVPQKTASYISQHDVHIAEMTVKETLDFSARCQGVGDKHGMFQWQSNMLVESAGHMSMGASVHKMDMIGGIGISK